MHTWNWFTKGDEFGRYTTWAHGTKFDLWSVSSLYPYLRFLLKFRATRLTPNRLPFRFRSPFRKDYVDYKRFCDAIEEVFCQSNLERAPLIVPLQHVPSNDDRNNFLNFDERKLVSAALNKLAKHPDQVANLSSLFEVLSWQIKSNLFISLIRSICRISIDVTLVQ